ncbi:MAG: chromosome segregation protein [Solirubrobacteraceae bacterium]|nr:chromosome segregation protein [Solirubrobacteraceae bacterium]
MHLKSVTIKGFKSFPDRTRLEFGEGVSVVVGPNGSGKSNITDAVLWALGEQSPLAVRGQSMQDVIFAGGRGVQARSEAEVELVLDNADGLIDLPASELSILRRLNRAGEGEYRLNGARCRLIDVLELLSDTGIGKEAHSVVSQGRVEAIVTSKPRDRRLLIEEAAGLGKHRKRRRRAQLKLERTQENLDRALDVEREARARLRPLKRQAEAAALHARLELQSLEARWELARDEARLREERRRAAETLAAGARTARAGVEAELAEVAGRREAAELALAERSERHDEISRRAFAARSARDRVALRLDQAAGLAARLEERTTARAVELTALRAEAGEQAATGPERITELEAELDLLRGEREARLEQELAALAGERDAAAARLAVLVEERAGLAAAGAAAETALEEARAEQRQAERAVEAARREAAGVGAELAAVNQFLRSHAAASGRGQALEHQLEAEPGCELALAAALGGRLAAVVVPDRATGEALLDESGVDGGRVLVERPVGDGDPFTERRSAPAGGIELADGVVAVDALPSAAGAPASGDGPCPGAVRLLDLVRGPPGVLALVARLLADAWVVESLTEVGRSFAGTAVTRTGRVWFGASGELRQAAAGGRERVLEERNRRQGLLEAVERAAQAEQRALAAGRSARQALDGALADREQADRARREAARAEADARERERRAEWLIDQRRAAPEQGETAVRRAQLEGELAAERRAVERAEQARAARARRMAVLAAETARDEALVPQARRLAAVLEGVGELLGSELGRREAELAADRAEGAGVAAQLRAWATAEAGIQARLREHGEAVTAAEVGAQQSRDRAEEAAAELAALADRLGLEAEPVEEPLGEAERTLLGERIERLARRREQLGPVNPLAAEEYREALERVEELEAQRTDLETALRELRALIRDTDRQIAASFEEAFTATARNFEELVGDVFPGGRGRLRLVREDAGPRPVLGAGEEPRAADAEAGAEAEAEAEAAAGESGPDELMGVEIEVTPAGKSMKRLTLLSGGEKSMTAIAFLFAVFLARPCPFYILDEVEAALDDLNIDRFLGLLRRYSSRAQFIVVTHQKRTMEAADWLYGVSMGGDGVSKLVSRRLSSVQLELGSSAGKGADDGPPLAAAAGAA